MRRRAFIALLGGGAMAWPLPARARQAHRMRRIAVLMGMAAGDAGAQRRVVAFERRLQELGWVAGRNVQIDYRWSVGEAVRARSAAKELAGLAADVLVGHTVLPALALAQATSITPIVFTAVDDPIYYGLVESLARPGGNATGLSILFTQLTSKRIELLCELIPQARTIALLVNASSPTAEPSIRGAQEAASTKGLQLSILRASTESEIDAAFATFVNLHADGLIIAADPFFDTRREQLVVPAARHRVPTIYFEREFSAMGGLISYGSSLPAVYRQMGIYAGRILKGEKPADLPVEQPTKFELVINLKTARTLGLNVPSHLVSTADEVID